MSTKPTPDEKPFPFGPPPPPPVPAVDPTPQPKGPLRYNPHRDNPKTDDEKAAAYVKNHGHAGADIERDDL